MNYNFDVDLATKYGLEESIMLGNLIHWVNKNKANGKHSHDGKTWTYNSVKAFCALYPFWSKKQIERILKSLKEQDIIMTGNYNESAYDRTCWYSLVNEELYTVNGNVDFPKQENGDSQKGKPIPDIKPVNKTNNVTDIFSNKSPEYKLSEIMLSKIKSNGTSMKDPDIQKWSKIFDFIHRIDKRDYDWIVELIDLVYKDNFWKDNVRSPEKLREQINSGKLDKLICKIKNWSTDEQVIEALNA